MTNWTRFVSPWAVVALAVWVVVMVVVANWAVPVFANVPSGPQCTATDCPRVTTEWVPVLLAGAGAATAVVAIIWGVRRLVRRGAQPE
jgi:hypothetical protein